MRSGSSVNMLVIVGTEKEQSMLVYGVFRGRTDMFAKQAVQIVYGLSKWHKMASAELEICEAYCAHDAKHHTYVRKMEP